jgi:multiple sugar transport system permease protein
MVVSTPPAPVVAPAKQDPPRRNRAHGKNQGRSGLLMFAPAGVLLLLFFFIPVALAFTLAFTDARLISPKPLEFIGLRNFERLADDPVFWKSLRNTLFFAAVIVPAQSGLALLLALLVNVKMRGTNLFRTLYFIPVVTSIVVVSILWRFMYQQDGLVNGMLHWATGNVVRIDWLNDPSTALPAIMLMSVWQAVGFHMVIWLSGLQTIPGELYEAADLDGAGPWQQFRYITWPGLRNTRTFILVTITIAALSLFTQVHVMTSGGPLDATTTVVYQAVRVGYQQQQTAYASAISVVFFVLVLTISLIQRWLTRERDA